MIDPPARRPAARRRPAVQVRRAHSTHPSAAQPRAGGGSGGWPRPRPAPAVRETVSRPDPAAAPLALVLYGARVPAGFPSPAEDHVEGRLG
ncbi:MAG: hypothetical protein MZV65_46740 [Chromatiales bacterium]|nr:hypothetical protein [Chromatiales bacterium]